MLPPPDAIRPLWRAFVDPPKGAIVTAGATDLVGSIAELKRHVAIEHDEDDTYLATLPGAALDVVGNYTRWPMRTTSQTVEARYPWPLRRGRHRRRLLLPGPASTRSNILTCEIHGGQLVPGDILPKTDLRRLSRLPHDAVLPLADEFEYDDEGRGELLVRYGVSWSDVYSGASPWPMVLAHTIYRVAATLYLYREATVQGDRPVRRIMESTLGPYLPVEV